MSKEPDEDDWDSGCWPDYFDGLGLAIRHGRVREPGYRLEAGDINERDAAGWICPYPNFDSGGKQCDVDMDSERGTDED